MRGPQTLLDGEKVFAVAPATGFTILDRCVPKFNDVDEVFLLTGKVRKCRKSWNGRP